MIREKNRVFWKNKRRDAKWKYKEIEWNDRQRKSNMYKTGVTIEMKGVHVRENIFKEIIEKTHKQKKLNLSKGKWKKGIDF